MSLWSMEVFDFIITEMAEMLDQLLKVNIVVFGVIMLTVCRCCPNVVERFAILTCRAPFRRKIY